MHNRLTAFFQDNLGRPAPEGYTTLDFAKATDDRARHQLDRNGICKSFAPRSRQITTPAPRQSSQVFYGLNALPAAQPTQRESTEGMMKVIKKTHRQKTTEN